MEERINIDNGKQLVYHNNNKFKYNRMLLPYIFNNYETPDRNINNYGKRRKAWIGAAIGAATGIVGGILNAQSQKEQMRKQERIQSKQNAINMANSFNQMLNNSDDIMNDYNNKINFGTFKFGGKRKYKCGGRTKADYGLWANIIQNAGNAIGSIVDDYNSKNNNVQIETPIETNMKLGGKYRNKANYGLFNRYIRF